VLNEEMNRCQSMRAVIDGSPGTQLNDKRGVTSFVAYSSLIVFPASWYSAATSP